jgi:2-dehydro-3-deoxyphosphogluconate aldolase/(4S)-4-hydroxy-2-oxoglutarate aldolase
MKKTEAMRMIDEIAIIPAVRVFSAEEAHFAADAVTSGGIPIVEITMTVPEAVELIAHLVRHHGKMLVGAGTVLDTETARRCADAGAGFLTAPGFDPAIVEFAAKQDLAVLPGALTPTEIVTAWRAGADYVKVYPCSQVGGDKYIKTLHTALPEIPLIAAGGVNQQTAAHYILAGASAIGVGAELIPADAIKRREVERIRELAGRFVGFVAEARERLGTKKDVPPPAAQAASRTDFAKLHKDSASKPASGS